MSDTTADTTASVDDADVQLHTSVLLEYIIAQAPADHFTLEWLIGNLPKHSFGFIILFLALIGFLPVISFISRILIIILAFQIIFGYSGPVLPRRLMERPLPSKYLRRLTHHIIPALKCLEQVVRPRWSIMLKGTRRMTAFIAMLGTLLSIPVPLPLSNIPPAAISVLMALAYIEHDGLVLVVALVSAIIMLAFISWICFEPFLV